MSIFGVFFLISIIYIFVGIGYLYRVITRWRELWDADVTQADLWLARGASFYLLIPPAVALHELGHAVAIWAQGRVVEDFAFWGYMGVVYVQHVGGIRDFAVALAGNVVTLLIGVGCIVLAMARPGHPIRNVFGIELGRQSLFLVLLAYPVLCIAFPGDFQTIYDFDETPVASSITAVAHGILLALGYGVVWRKKWEPRAKLLESPLAPRMLEMERRVKQESGDHAAHRELGFIYAAGGDAYRARKHLEKAIEGGGVDARMHLVYGSVLSELGEHERAIGELGAALAGLLRPEDRLSAELPLARSLLALRRIDEARARLESILRAHPEHREAEEMFRTLPRP